MRSTGKWFTSLEQPHDEIHLAIGGQDHQPVKRVLTEVYDENGDVLTSSTKVSAQVGLGARRGRRNVYADCQSIIKDQRVVLFMVMFTVARSG